MRVSTLGFSADTIAEVSEELFELQESFVSKARKPGAWSRKQILGHLIDSACVNLRRFVDAQVSGSIVFEGYAHREWVELQGYQQQDWEELVTLWSALNMHICNVVERIPAEVLDKEHAEHRFDRMAYRPVPKDQPSTLGYIIEDYFAHLKHHLDQVLPR